MINIVKSNKKEYGINSTGEGYDFTISLPVFKTAELALYDLSGRQLGLFDISSYKLAGCVYSFRIEGLDTNTFEYEYICDGKSINDPYMMGHLSRRQYGLEKGNTTSIRALYSDNTYDFEGDCQLKLKPSDVISYQLHVRGFTKHSSSKVKGKGCFKGIIEKIHYFNELGINQIEIMPAYDFYEFDSEKDKLAENHPAFITDVTVDEKGNKVLNKPSVKLNYWGFKKANYFCPKYEYSYSDDAVTEFKDMVKALHRAGIEIIMQMYFPKNIKDEMVIDALRFWYIEYHVDGFHVFGERIPENSIISDDILSEAKLYLNNLNKYNDVAVEYSKVRQLYSINEGFMSSIRKYLKSDSNTLSSFIYANRSNPSDIHTLNYITCYEGFTLADLVSYEHKHNEDNGENNTDGRDDNLSWNCGIEGKSSKKQVKELRMKQAKNAMTMLLLSQGTPMLFMGDELLNSQKGNNNPYCQDNDITWINWKSSKSSLEFFEFTKMLIAFRKNHPVTHQPGELKNMDYLSCGNPDISYHQDMAWKSDFNDYQLHIGIMLDGSYVNKNGRSDDTLYFAYNMHWENHNFGLPKLKKGMKWKVVFSTDDSEEGKTIEKELEKSQEEVCVNKRSILVLKVEERPL